MLKFIMTRSIALVLLCSLSVSAYAVANGALKRPINIPSEDLATALEQLSKQSGTDLVYRPEQVRGFSTHGLVGEFSAEEAVAKLLEGTPLTFSTDPSGAMLIAAPSASTAVQVSPVAGADGHREKEGKKDSSGQFLLAQVDQGQTSSPSTVEKQDAQASKKKPLQLEEVVITGSRIPTVAGQGPQDVKIYTREKIEQSGQTTVADFLNTLPEISTSVGQSTYQTVLGGTTVRLRGLPLGTTLVLINGRRVQTSGTQASGDFFDLGNIPLAAVERVEVLADGSSAIYGSDAIAGVVNIILRNDFNGLEVDVRDGRAPGAGDLGASLALGKHWGRGSASVIATYEKTDELLTADRAITRSNNYTAFGGPDNNYFTCSPGNVFSVDGSNLPGLSAPYAAVPSGTTGTPSIQQFVPTAGTLNKCALLQGVSVIPKTDRLGVFAQGNYPVGEALQLFGEAMYSHVKLDTNQGYQLLYGQPGFQSFTLSAANPYNPFGKTVGISELLPTLPPSTQQVGTDFYRVVLGAKGSLFERWKWETSIWTSEDSTDLTQLLGIVDYAGIQNALNSSNPATALNPLVSGPPGSEALLQSLFSDTFTRYVGRGSGASGFVRGSLFELPTGQVSMVAGAEYEHDGLFSDEIKSAFAPPNTTFSAHRESYALYGEVRIPIIANSVHPEAAPVLAATVAGRRDHYSDFGSKSTPQLELDWRPWDTLLVRGTYAESFKAPSLFTLFTPQTTVPQVVTDPKTGKLTPVTVVQGGNPNLRPATGESYSYGVVYSAKSASELHLSMSAWSLEQNDPIKLLSTAALLANEDLFPGNVIRAPSCSSGPPCPITSVLNTYVNFGKVNVKGIDYGIDDRFPSRFGELTTALNASLTYHYTASLLPGQPLVDRVAKANDDGLWAPRWKGNVNLGWRKGYMTANVVGRYVGRYQDYGSTREIGNFWLYDANVRYAISKRAEKYSERIKEAYVEIGGVNLFNSLPQYSNYGGSFLGYDPTQADIRGRFLYARLGLKL